jgi:predicted Zn-ribbon and HTH transcriptional regulator
VGERGEEVGKMSQKEQPKEVVVWDKKERETLLKGATVVEVRWGALVLEKQGKHIIVEANCYQCGFGFGHFIVTVRE